MCVLLGVIPSRCGVGFDNGGLVKSWVTSNLVVVGALGTDTMVRMRVRVRRWTMSDLGRCVCGKCSSPVPCCVIEGFVTCCSCFVVSVSAVGSVSVGRVDDVLLFPGDWASTEGMTGSVLEFSESLSFEGGTCLEGGPDVSRTMSVEGYVSVIDVGVVGRMTVCVDGVCPLSEACP